MLFVSIPESGDQSFKSGNERTLGNRSYPLFNDTTLTVQEQEMRLVAIPVIPLEGGGVGVIDVQINEVDPIPPLLLQPVHDGRHAAAGPSPKSEELEQRRFAGCQVDALRICGF